MSEEFYLKWEKSSFSILNDGELFDCSLKEEQIIEWMSLDGEKIPLQSPLLWCEYYKLMGRKEKVEMIEKAYRLC